MRSGLRRNGALIPPRSLEAAISRRQRVTLEIARIEKQLREREGTADGEWAARALRVLGSFLDERGQLDAWIAVQRAELFREAYDFIKSLQRDGFDFEPQEMHLINRLDALFAATTPSTAKTSTKERG